MFKFKQIRLKIFEFKLRLLPSVGTEALCTEHVLF